MMECDVKVGKSIINPKFQMKISCTKVVGMNGPNSGSGVVVVVEVVPW